MPPVDWPAVLKRVTQSLNPVTASPGAPFETGAFLDSFGPSLMPRTSMTQGFMTGLVVLTARASRAQVETRHRNDGPFRRTVAAQGRGFARSWRVQAPPPPPFRNRTASTCGFPAYTAVAGSCWPGHWAESSTTSGSISATASRAAAASALRSWRVPPPPESHSGRTVASPAGSAKSPAGPWPSRTPCLTRSLRVRS